MGPILVLDKSALQALSKDEVIILHKFFSLNIPPILALEVLADLKKDKLTGKEEQEVIILSNKLLPFDATFNVHYRGMLIGSLMGKDQKADGRPVLGGGKNVVNEKGEKGIIFGHTEEEEAVGRWRRGDFNEAEGLLAEKWREIIREIDLEKFIRNVKAVVKDIPKLNSLDGVYQFVEELTESDVQKREVLSQLLYEFNLEEIGSQVFWRWEAEGRPLVKVFAPYAFFCLKINLFFKLGLVNNLISTRSTNKLDLEYLYYLPFCMAFTSRDKFHHQIANYFLKPEQSFVEGGALKEDLGLIFRERDALKAEERMEWNKVHFMVPPDREGSICLELWKKYMDYEKARKQRPAPPQRDSSVADRINADLKAASTNEKFGTDEATYIIKKRMMSLTDMCICGSGEQFKDCCGRLIWEEEQRKKGTEK